MRATVICIDTRGGVQPYLALAVGLNRAGHTAVIVAPEGYRDFIESAGVVCRGISGDMQADLQRPEVAAVIEKGFRATHKLMVEHAATGMRNQTRECLAACAGADVILAGFGGMLVGEGVAEKLGVPLVQAHVQPLTPTPAFPGVICPARLRSAGGLVNRVSHAVSRQVFWQPLRGAVNAARKEVLGLAPARFWGNAGRVRTADDLVLYGYSPSVLPRHGDWPAGIRVTGYWFLDHATDYSPPAGLAEFLAAGPPPVCVGFGSMSSRNAEATTRLALDAAERSGQRVVLLAGWGGMTSADVPDWAYLTESVPHSWLFPRMSLAVHHGGAGTTGAALRAGIPQVVVPFAADQTFWGWLVSSRGLGACPGPRKSLTAAKLADAISTTLANRNLIARAKAVGGLVRAEDGVREAVAALESAYTPSPGTAAGARTPPEPSSV